MTNGESRLTVADFDYVLPRELIAQTPLQERDSSRLMVVDRVTGSVSNGLIRQLPARLNENDIVVVNNTRVLPARIIASKCDTGGRVELLLLHRDVAGAWTCLARPSKNLRPGQLLQIDPKKGAERTIIEVVAKGVEGEVSVKFGAGDDARLNELGNLPLPPYIKVPLATPERYQTVYAQVPGSAAAPTAGLHITERMKRELEQRGVRWAEVTLHIGLDTFRPVTVETIEEHRIHKEWCSLPTDVARAIREATSSAGRVVAVGTTSARTLEMWGSLGSPAEGFEGWTDLFITPGYRWKVVDALLTNFHLPRSTLMMMVSAFAGVDLIRKAYAEAIKARYRFYSFGDAMLIE
jgi:S-adenosylmethionine:tRNA ribosyltransferase-isomerase